MNHPYSESPAESSYTAASHVRKVSETNDDPDLLLEELAPDPTYKGKGKGKAVSNFVSYRSTRSTLLGLPAELRNRVYELVLWCRDGIRIDENLKMIDQPTNFLAITKACRQIYAETRLLLYSTNTFIIDFSLIFWLRLLPDDQREAVTSIELSFTLLMRLDHPGGSWYSDPVRQNENYAGMLLMILPGLDHVNLAIRIELSTPMDENGERMKIVPELRDVQRFSGPFKESFEQSTAGMRITTTTY